ncbi:hypothetical protein [Micromonospora sp. NPDC005324]|uniref:hypothetical protein n=1 Tax=Micromonospora sp. NPDC005324 TaxID=3157033 RepID=UPI0033A7A22C
MPTTTQRGYGWAHQQARAAALAHLAQVGTLPCPFCTQAMTTAMRLHYDHYPPLALGGGGPGTVRRLAHASCNCRAGQQLAQQRRTHTSTKRKTPRKPTRSTINSRRW